MKNKISFQRNIRLVSNLWTYTIEEVFDFIKTGCNWSMDIRNETKRIQAISDHDLQNDLKNQLLPYCCFNGTFSYRCESGLIEYSKYTAIDYDGLDDETMNKVKQWLMQNPYVKFFYVSPSGHGLKVIVEHTNTNPKKHRSLYQELLTRFCISNIDPKTKDLQRATFLCHDPDAWWNDNCQPYRFDESKYQDDVVISSTTPSAHNSLRSDYVAMEKLLETLQFSGSTNIKDASIKRIVESWIDNDPEIKPGNRNNRLYHYACTLCKAGVKYKSSLYLLNKKFQNVGLGEIEILNTTCSAFSKLSDKFGSERDSKFKK